MKQNKYQEALDFLQEECRTIKKGEAKKYVEVLQELVNKATPKEVIYGKEYISFDHCPTCKEVVPIHVNYCSNCGQKLDWEKAVEKKELMKDAV